MIGVVIFYLIWLVLAVWVFIDLCTEKTSKKKPEFLTYYFPSWLYALAFAASIIFGFIYMKKVVYGEPTGSICTAICFVCENAEKAYEKVKETDEKI